MLRDDSCFGQVPPHQKGNCDFAKLNHRMRKQLDITRTDLHVLWRNLLYFMPRYIIRPVFYGPGLLVLITFSVKSRNGLFGIGIAIAWVPPIWLPLSSPCWQDEDGLQRFPDLPETRLIKTIFPSQLALVHSLQEIHEGTFWNFCLFTAPKNLTQFIRSIFGSRCTHDIPHQTLCHITNDVLTLIGRTTSWQTGNGEH